MNESRQVWITRFPTPYAASYLAYNPAGGLIIDSDLPGSDSAILHALQCWQINPEDIHLIVLTHGHLDHGGSAGALRRITGAPVALHPDDWKILKRAKVEVPPIHGYLGWTRRFLIRQLLKLIPYEPIEPDIELYSGQRLDQYGIFGQVVAIPGHTGGSIALLLDSGEIFIGDLGKMSRGELIPNRFAQDLAQLKQSVEQVRLLRPTLIYPGHGQPCRLMDQ